MHAVKKIEKEIKSNQNTKLIELLNYAKSLNIDNYYIGAGCIAQTIWNYQIGNDINYGISDYDFVYYDNDLSEEVESKLRDKINSDLAHLNVRIDVKNQARVHLWYEKSFGFCIAPALKLTTVAQSPLVNPQSPLSSRPRQ